MSGFRVTLGAAALGLALAATSCAAPVEAPSGGAAPVEVSLEEMRITPVKIAVAAGEAVTLTVRNAGQAEHSFAVDVGGHIYETPSLRPGATEVLELPPLDPGVYSAWCTVAGHRESGMTAVLEAAAGATAGATAGGDDETAMAGMGGGLTAEQMAEGHLAGVKAFPAPTEAQGNQVLEPALDGDVKVYSLRAEEVRWEVAPGSFVTAFGYNGMVPGPQLRVRTGDRVRVVLENELAQPTTLHFHGVTVPNDMDGVPYVSQDPVMAGRYFVYEFTVADDPGTYMYHSHFNSTEQVGMGLFGAMVVEPDRPGWDVEHTVVLADGPLGYTINGKGFPATQPLVVGRGDRVLVRLVNAGQQLHPMHLHGYHFEVVARDGFPLDETYMADTLVVAPGERFDVVVDARLPGIWALHCHILSHAEDAHGMFGMVTALIVE